MWHSGDPNLKSLSMNEPSDNLMDFHEMVCPFFCGHEDERLCEPRISSSLDLLLGIDWGNLRCK